MTAHALNFDLCKSAIINYININFKREKFRKFINKASSQSIELLLKKNIVSAVIGNSYLQIINIQLIIYLEINTTISNVYRASSFSRELLTYDILYTDRFSNKLYIAIKKTRKNYLELRFI